jgi:hypothetical protein
MEVVSIADFERDQLRYQDRVMESAVDQLEAFSQQDAPTDVVVQFGSLKVDDASPRLFEFDAPTTCRRWPGLLFGSSCLHRQIPKSAKTKKSSEKKHGRLEELQHGVRPRKATTYTQSKPRKLKARNPSPTISSAPTVSRIPPLRLMDLPAEVRNEIWTLLSIQQDPIEAQLRQIQPGKVLKGGKIITRRFPQEPAISAVSRQIRMEVLSLFYGLNRFVFEKSSSSILKDLSMTNLKVIKAWMPCPNVSRFLTHIDLRFEATMPAPGGTFTIVYRLTRLPDHDATITVHTSRSTKKGKSIWLNAAVCLCRERKLARKVEATSTGCGLADVAEDLVRKRLADFRLGPPYNSAGYFPLELHCDKCGNDHFEVTRSEN